MSSSEISSAASTTMMMNLSNSMANFSLPDNITVEEINQNRELFKQAIGFYSSNVKCYAKWFEISEVNKNEETYTSYKVVYRVKITKKNLINDSLNKLIYDFFNFFCILSFCPKI